jgi:hypothetical protein
MFWLYKQVLNEQQDREPLFAQQSTVNWMQALRHEIEAEHGTCAEDQLKACRLVLRGSRKTNPVPSLAGVFEPLYSGITNSMTLDRLSQAQTGLPWVRPSAIVTWYYAVYACTRAMFAAFGQPVGDNHSAAMKAYVSVLSPRMPHPLNMRARHVKDEQYDGRLPTYPHAVSAKLSVNFTPSRDVAQGMLLEYLSGNANWYADRTKQQILQGGKFRDFRSKVAREERNRRLQKEIGFLHCAFRYRGKANYRDAIYLTYGMREPAAMLNFLEDLAATSKFFVVLALTFAEQHYSTTEVATFLSDVRQHLRGIAEASQSELYWENLYP